MVLVGMEVKVASCMTGWPRAHTAGSSPCFRNVRNVAMDGLTTRHGAAQVGTSDTDGSGQPIGPIFSDQSIETLHFGPNRLPQKSITTLRNVAGQRRVSSYTAEGGGGVWNPENKTFSKEYLTLPGRSVEHPAATTPCRLQMHSPVSV